MIVASRIVKPHIVKKWASPGTVHLSNFRWPATSVNLGVAHLGEALPATRGGGAGANEAREPVEAASRDREEHERGADPDDDAS